MLARQERSFAAGDGVGLFVEADFDCGEVVAAAAHGQACIGDRTGLASVKRPRIFAGGSEICLLSFGQRLAEFERSGRPGGRAGRRRRGEAGAGSVGLPFVREQAGVGVYVAVLRRELKGLRHCCSFPGRSAVVVLGQKGRGRAG